MEQNGFGPLSPLAPLINEMDKQLPPFVYDPRPPDPEAKPEYLSEKQESKIWCHCWDVSKVHSLWVLSLLLSIAQILA